MNRLKLILGTLAISLALTACGSNNNNAAPAASVAASQPAETTAASAEAGQFPMTISSTVSTTENEDVGTVQFEEVTFEAAPQKMVVFDYGFLDTLDALGVEGVIGIAKGSSVPEHLQKYNADSIGNAGTLKAPLLEDIAEMRPDVIFISGRQSAFYEDLKEIAPVVFVGTSQDNYWNTFLASVDIATKLFGKEKEAEELLAKFDAKIAEISTLAGNFDTTLVSMYNEGKLSGFAQDSRFGYIYDIYGFKPVTDDINSSSHGSDFGFEAILEFNPQVLLVIDRTAATGGESNIAKDMENAIIKKTEAYANNRIIYLDGNLWYLSGGGLTSEMMKIDEILAELK